MISICLIYSSFFFFFSILSFLFSLLFVYLNYMFMLEYHIVSLNCCDFLMTIYMDWMSLLFMSFVMFISSMVIYYSEEYMYGDKNINRFILLVCMFVLSMIFLIISPNLISILLGWDGLGLVSYCLVIYYQNIKSYNAGMLTALSNRIGDVALLMAIAWMLNYGSWNYIFYLNFMKNDLFMMIITYLIMLAALTKSAQIPFSAWLPAAMAAPTPVSSLVHSSTLVTAGVYLLIRFSPCLSGQAMMVLLFISSLTMFMAGLGANYEFDLKKIIALSTLSQLGLMMSILALGNSDLAFFHLLTHALFKALLFMCAGVIIHNSLNCQDIRFMGGYINCMPLTSIYFIIANLSLCGFPFLSGFYSKDLILEVSSMNFMGMYMYMLMFISTGLTMMYTMRMIYYVVLGDFNFMSLNVLSENLSKMSMGMFMLFIMVIFGGSVLSWIIFPAPYMICLSFLMKVMALVVTAIGGWLGYEISQFKMSNLNNSYIFNNMSNFLGLMWNMPLMSVKMSFYPLLLGKEFLKLTEYGWIEFYGSQQIYKQMSAHSSEIYRYFFNNKIYMLLLVVFIFYLSLIY
uniref:NADH-ubiquinone oxidoreductase chain 5 n=1 Tax=Scirtidae sp. BMNH 1274304 TaxID=1796542 RepID=A0A126TFC1_9COLE|nr:NADH dehydrogenase subunit 5 [Scirtidae sp. BMNH 1274304]